MFEARGHLLDTPNHSLSVIVKSWLERKKSFTKKQKKKKLSIDWDKYRSAATESRLIPIQNNSNNSSNNNSNPKPLYSYIKNKQVDNIGVEPPTYNGKVSIDDKDKAKILNSQFASVFSTDKYDIPSIQTIC